MFQPFRVRVWPFLWGICAVLPLAGGAAVQAQSKPKPNPPITGRYSVQWFIGGTQKCMVCVYPPLNYTDGTPLKAGDKVEVKFYRSYDGGRTYGEKGVKLVKQAYVHFRNPETRQNRFDPARIDWIDCHLETPVSPPRRDDVVDLLGQRADGTRAFGKDTTVYLACSVVVNGVESDRTNRFLTFAYAVSGIPELVRYETPNSKEQPVPTRVANVPSQVLADRGGVWEGTYMLTTYSIHENFKNSPQLKQEGCQEFLRKLDAALGKRCPMSIRVTSMVPDFSDNPAAAPMTPGTADVTMSQIDDHTKTQTTKADVVYHRNRALVILESRSPTGTMQLIGNVFEGATHYEIDGSLRARVVVEGTDAMVIHGLWTVRRKK